MALRIYNTLTHRKELFEPLTPGRVRMYVCGVTVYDECHVGHARSAIVFDVIYRYLMHRGYQVDYVRNFTDIDDKILERARRDGVPWDRIARTHIETFHRDMDALGVLRPTLEPLATEHVPEMIRIIEGLTAKGVAYAADGNVYFSVKRFPQYGRLSRRDHEQLMAGARIEVDDRKDDPMDFALWKRSLPGEPAWDSPWGPGRPGWHIECSAMSRKYLGDTFDIHGGGLDLVFPHHENEIAQSQSFTGKPFARLWIHNGPLTREGVKMSKSLGNILSIQDALGRFHAEEIRMFMLMAHYRKPLDFTPQGMAEAQSALDRLYSTLRRLDRFPAPSEAEQSSPHGDPSGPVIAQVEAFQERFHAAMDDDFNTAQALAHLFELTRSLNHVLDEASAGTVSSVLLAGARACYATCRDALGILQHEPGAFFLQKERFVLDGNGLSRPQIEEMIRRRSEARKARDWAEADRIREALLHSGIQILDTPHGTSWKVRPSQGDP
jgi:cysteinyl-tRNA synthetase